MLTNGATIGHDPVTTLVLKLSSGREITVDLPTASTAATARSAAEMKLSPLARSILEVLRSCNEWLFGADIASSLPGEVNHRAGNFRAALKDLKDSELILSDPEKGYRIALLEAK